MFGEAIMRQSFQNPLSSGIAGVLNRLFEVERDLLTMIRARAGAGHHSGRLAEYEAHAFVRQAIRALSQQAK
jgi:hypothetical protein